MLDDYSGEPEAISAAYPQRCHLLPKIRGIFDTLEAELPEALETRMS